MSIGVGFYVPLWLLTLVILSHTKSYLPDELKDSLFLDIIQESQCRENLDEFQVLTYPITQCKLTVQFSVIPKN